MRQKGEVCSEHAGIENTGRVRWETPDAAASSAKFQ